MATLLIFENKLALKVTYEQRNLAKEIPGYKWNSDMKVWQYPVDRMVVAQMRKIFGPDLKVASQVEDLLKRMDEKRIQMIQVKEATDATINVPFADKLRPYQRVGVDYLTKTKRAILADDMGTGKTIQAITTCENAGHEKVLVVCPNTLKWTWLNEVGKWTDSVAVVVNGAKNKRMKAIQEFKGKYLIINYESLRIHEELATMRWDAIIFDEAHKLKNRKAQQTVVAKKVKSENIYLLTGTPMLNRPDELWSLLNRLYPEKFRSYWRFVEQYCQLVHNGYANEIVGCTPEQEKALRETLAPIMIRRTKAEILPDLPEKVHQRHVVALEGEQKKLYKQMEKDAIAKLTQEEVIAAPVVIAQITRLRQLAISPQLLSHQVQESAKFNALMDLIKDNHEGHKIVVFSQFRKAIELFSERLTTEGIRWTAVTGKVSQKDRNRATKDFQEDKNTRVMLATIEAAAHGLTWTSGDIAIFLDRHWTPAINTQAEDRLHRIGQKNSVTIINLVAENTIEERIENMLEGKAQGFDEIINKQVSASMMLEMLKG